MIQNAKPMVASAGWANSASARMPGIGSFLARTSDGGSKRSLGRLISGTVAGTGSVSASAGRTRDISR